jgi:hypothetical protein
MKIDKQAFRDSFWMTVITMGTLAVIFGTYTYLLQ